MALDRVSNQEICKENLTKKVVFILKEKSLKFGAP